MDESAINDIIKERERTGRRVVEYEGTKYLVVKKKRTPLRHPILPVVYGSAICNGTTYYVIEYLETTLSNYRHSYNKSTDWYFSIIADIASGFAFLHNNGYICNLEYGDIYISNGRAKICRYGVTDSDKIDELIDVRAFHKISKKILQFIDKYDTYTSIGKLATYAGFEVSPIFHIIEHLKLIMPDRTFDDYQLLYESTLSPRIQPAPHIGVRKLWNEDLKGMSFNIRLSVAYRSEDNITNLPIWLHSGEVYVEIYELQTSILFLWTQKLCRYDIVVTIRQNIQRDGWKKRWEIRRWNVKSINGEWRCLGYLHLPPKSTVHSICITSYIEK